MILLNGLLTISVADMVQLIVHIMETEKKQMVSKLLAVPLLQHEQFKNQEKLPIDEITIRILIGYICPKTGTLMTIKILIIISS